MLFLGAGASSAFNIPTMTTFVHEILNSLPTNSQKSKAEFLKIDWKKRANVLILNRY